MATTVQPRVSYQQRWAEMPLDDKLALVGDKDALADIEGFLAGHEAGGDRTAIDGMYRELAALAEEILATKDYINQLYMTRKRIFIKMSLAGEEQAHLARAAKISSMMVSTAIGASTKQR